MDFPFGIVPSSPLSSLLISIASFVALFPAEPQFRLEFLFFEYKLVSILFM